MKKITFTLMLILAVLLTNGQTEKRFSYITTAGTGIAINTPSSTPFTWHISGYYNFNNRLAAGCGTGLAFYEKPLLPLFAGMRFLVIRPRKFTPFLECNAGYSFALHKKANGGFYFNPSAGIQYAAFGNTRILVAVGWEKQHLERTKNYGTTLFISEFREKLNHNSISIKVGFVF